MKTLAIIVTFFVSILFPTNTRAYDRQEVLEISVSAGYGWSQVIDQQGGITKSLAALRQLNVKAGRLIDPSRPNLLLKGQKVIIPLTWLKKQSTVKASQKAEEKTETSRFGTVDCQISADRQIADVSPLPWISTFRYGWQCVLAYPNPVDAIRYALRCDWASCYVEIRSISLERYLPLLLGYGVLMLLFISLSVFVVFTWPLIFQGSVKEKFSLRPFELEGRAQDHM